MAVARGKKRLEKAPEESWAAIFDQWRHSGLSAKKYCEREGYSFWGFKRSYEKQFGKRPKAINRQKKLVGAEPLFVPLGIANSSEQERLKKDSVQSASNIEIASGNRAFVVRVQSGFDPAVLRQVLEVIGGM